MKPGRLDGLFIMRLLSTGVNRTTTQGTHGMKLMHKIDVWQPKWSTMEVLIAPYKIKPGINKVVFTKCDYPNLIMSDKKLRSYPMTHNGSIGVYRVPIADFAREKSNQLMLIEE